MVTKKYTIVICGNTPIDANPLGAVGLAKSLAKEHNVIYVEPPLSYATLIKKPQLRDSLKKPRLRKHESGLYVLTVVVSPGKDRPFLNNITSFLLQRSIRKALVKLKLTNTDIAIVATSPIYQAFTPGHINIVWVMDDYVSEPELIGVNPKVVKNNFMSLINNATLLMCASNKLKEIFNDDPRCTVITNGGDSTIFKYPSSMVFSKAQELPDEPFILYTGGLNARIDISTLQAITDTKLPLVLAGPANNILASDIEKLAQQDNVTYLSSVDQSELGTLMNLATVGIVPYAKGSFNDASMPLKIPEYLMSGLPVVSTDLSFAHDISNVDIAKDNDHFVQLCKERLSNPLSENERKTLSSQSTQHWSWNAKATEFIKMLDNQ